MHLIREYLPDVPIVRCFVITKYHTYTLYIHTLFVSNISEFSCLMIILRYFEYVYTIVGTIKITTVEVYKVQKNERK